MGIIISATVMDLACRWSIIAEMTILMIAHFKCHEMLKWNCRANIHYFFKLEMPINKCYD